VLTTGEAGWSLQSTTIRLLTIAALRSSSSSTMFALRQPFECHLNHSDRAVDDTRAGGDDCVGLLSAQHGLGDLWRVGKMADAHLDDLHSGNGDAFGHLGGELAGDDVGRARSDRPLSAGLS